MIWVLALIAVLAVIGMACLASSSYVKSQHSEHQSKSHQNDGQADPRAKKDGDENIQHESKPYEQQSYWERFIGFIEAHDRFINAVSTATIGAFTVALFLATALLWKASETTAKHQLRAYIGPFSMESTVYPFDGAEYAFIAHVEMRNFGQTPAYEVKSWSSAKLDVPTAMPFDMPADETISKLGGAIAFPNAGFHVNVGWKISTADKEALMKREKVFFVWGVITYKDAFDRSHYFRYRLISGKIAIGTGGVYELGPHGLGYEAD